MIYDGIKWRKTKTVIEIGNEQYCKFGRIVSYDKTYDVLNYNEGELPKDAVDSGRKWDDRDKTTLYAVPIKGGHGLTNKLYGNSYIKDDSVWEKGYLKVDGRCYTATWINNKKTLERHQEIIILPSREELKVSKGKWLKTYNQLRNKSWKKIVDKVLENYK